MPAQKLKKLIGLEQKLFPYIESILDRKIVASIACAEEEGCPLCSKQLYMEDLEGHSVASCRRRLARLVAAGVVLKSVRDGDGRMTLLRLSPRTRRAIGAYWEVIRNLAREESE